MYVDVKYTVWDRITIDEAVVNDVEDGFVNDMIHSPNDLWQFSTEHSVEQLTDCVEWMTPNDNAGNATIEVYKDDSKEYVYSNAVEVEEEMSIAEAMNVLKTAGYHTDVIWMVDDVMNRFDCSKDEAVTVLERVIGSELLISNTFEMIDDAAWSLGLKSREEFDD